MAFDLNGFSNGSNSQKGAPTAHTYKTEADAIATVDASAYFDQVALSLLIGDTIFVAASDANSFRVVTATTPNVTVAAITL